MNLKVYDYLDDEVEFQIPDKPISCIFVVILSGDETGAVLFEDGQIFRFDASEHRYEDIYDGYYIVQKEGIQKWMDYQPVGVEKGYSYNRAYNCLWGDEMDGKHETTQNCETDSVLSVRARLQVYQQNNVLPDRV